MADVIITDSRVVETTDGLVRESGLRLAGVTDEATHEFAAELKKNGTATSASGYTCKGWFVRADGVTVELDGTVSTSTVKVRLTAACYEVEGRFTLAMQLVKTGSAVTVRLLEGYIYPTITETLVESAQASPSISQVLSVLDGKMPTPTGEGAAGMVATSDGNGGLEWRTPEALTVAGTVQVDGNAYTLRTGSSGVTGAITFVT